jgi:hypothetical protein
MMYVSDVCQMRRAIMNSKQGIADHYLFHSTPRIFHAGYLPIYIKIYLKSLHRATQPTRVLTAGRSGRIVQGISQIAAQPPAQSRPSLAATAIPLSTLSPIRRAHAAPKIRRSVGTTPHLLRCQRCGAS